MEDPSIGTEVDGYRIQEVLGRGGMGVVYKAEDLALHRQVAMKRLHPQFAGDESFLRRFRSEARAIARIDSPYIVQIFTLTETELGLVIVMEYVEGRTLKQRITAGDAGWEESLPVIQQMLTALRHAHGAGVIHRDIKPQNILLSDIVLAHGIRAKMTDFGLAKVNTSGDPNRTITQGVYGTLHYMSPEQVEGHGEIDHRTDLYSLGMTCYEMLAGRLPFDEDSTEYTIMRTIVEEDLPELGTFASEVPDELRDIVMKAVAKDPEDRFQNAAEMQDAIGELEEASDHWYPDQEPATIPADLGPPEEELGEDREEKPPPAPSDRDASAGSMIRRMGGVAAVLAAVLAGVWYFAVGSIAPPPELPPVPVERPNNEVIDNGEDIDLNASLDLDEQLGTSGGPPPEGDDSDGTEGRADPVDVPAAIESLLDVTDPKVLRKQIDERVERGEMTRGSGPEAFFAPGQCYIFVVEGGRVSVVLGPRTDGGRTNLRTEQEVADWSTRYSDSFQIWVDLTGD